MLVRTHGRIIMGAVLNGFAGAAPRSATPNLIELLSTLTQRFPAESRQWMTEVLFAVGVVPLNFLKIYRGVQRLDAYRFACWSGCSSSLETSTRSS